MPKFNPYNNPPFATAVIAGDLFPMIAGESIGAAFTATLGSTNTAALGATFTASTSVTSTALVVTAVTGYISIGDTVSGSGISDSPTIIAQVSGTTGGAGTYTLSAPETSTGGTTTCFGRVVAFSAVSTYLSVGDTVAGTGGFPSGAVITGQLTGTAGAAGHYTISTPGTAYTASATGVTTFGFTLDVTAITGSLSVGSPVVDSSHSVVPANTVIASQVSGAAGGTGIYTLSLPSTTAYHAGDTFYSFAGAYNSIVLCRAPSAGTNYTHITFQIAWSSTAGGTTVLVVGSNTAPTSAGFDPNAITLYTSTAKTTDSYTDTNNFAFYQIQVTAYTSGGSLTVTASR